MTLNRGYNNRAIKIDNEYLPYVEWNINDGTRWQRHRAWKPAVVWRTDHCEWWVRGTRYIDTTAYCAVLKASKMRTMAMLLKYGESLPTKIHQL